MSEPISPGRRLRKLRVLVAAHGGLLMCGCMATGTVEYRFSIPHDQGRPTDQKIVPGSYLGYDLLGRCASVAWTQHRIMVRGQGARRVARQDGAGWGDEMLALRLRAQRALGPVAQAVWYESDGCHRGDVVLTAFVATYGQIDPAIERLGGLMRDENLGDSAAIVLLRSGPEGQLTYDKKWHMPLARRPFYPYEASLAAGARHQDRWDTAMAVHLGLVWGREEESPSKAGWFWGLGLDGRTGLGSGSSRWSAGPSLRLGRAFGGLTPDRPGPGTNRGTYVYAQTAAEWSTRGPVMVLSLGFTTLAVGEFLLTRRACPFLLPLALLNHVEVGWALDAAGENPSAIAVLLGFSL